MAALEMKDDSHGKNKKKQPKDRVSSPNRSAAK